MHARRRVAQVLQLKLLERLQSLIATLFCAAAFLNVENSMAPHPLVCVLPWKWDETPDGSYVSVTSLPAKIPESTC